MTALCGGKRNDRGAEQSPPAPDGGSLVLRLGRLLELAARWSLWRPGGAFRAMCVLLFIVGLWRFSYPFVADSEVSLANSEPIQISLHQHAGRGFSSPFYSHFTGPTAHAAPVFPYFLTFIWVVFGIGASGVFVFSNAAAVALAAQAALLPAVARSLGMHVSVGLLAALITIAPRNGVKTFFLWEANYVALLVLLVTLGMCKMVQGPERPLRHSVLLSFLWGVLLLASPGTLLPYCGWLVWLAFFARKSHLPKRDGIASLAAMVVIPALVLLPWTLRNHSVFGEWFFVRDNLGLELMVSNNHCAQFGAKVNQGSGCYDTIHPQSNASIARRLQQMGEPAFNREMREKAVEWIRQNPRQFFTLTLQRFWFFWFPSTVGDNLADLLGGATGLTLLFGSTTLLSIPGLFLLFKKHRAGGVFCLLWLGCFPLIHYVVQFEDRYRAPILWLTFLLGAYALMHAGLWIMRRAGLPESSIAPYDR